ncbi:MAG: lipoate--protein ligase [Syntrophomonadaceae bacterium]|jgi:lipoate-protein ligase A
MINIVNNSHHPYFNLALEEYVLTTMDKSHKYCILWQNEPAVIVGRNQNTAGEINEALVNAEGIKVVRRITGGGAVYHDLGNLNFTFIVPETGLKQFDFARFTRPVIRTLALLGVDARNEGRNDITIAGRKISGNAQCRRRGRIMHHGTILFDTDFTVLEKVLTAGQDKIQSHGVASVRSRVTNIKEHLPADISIQDFKNLLLKTIKEEENLTDYHLSAEELAEVNQLAQSKYSTWEWNYGTSPWFNVRLQKRFDWGAVEIRLGVKKGLVTSCRIWGDFFALKELDSLEKHFLSRSYSNQEMIRALQEIDVSEYITGAVRQDFISLFQQ